MKKAISVILTATMLAALISGCSGSATGASQSTTPASESAETEANEAEATETEATDASESTDEKEEAAEAAVETPKAYYRQIRETRKLADGTVVSDRINDEDFIDSTYISRNYDGSYRVTTSDSTLNDAGQVTERKSYMADPVESIEGFNADDYKTEEYLQDIQTNTYNEDGKLLSTVDNNHSQEYEYDDNGFLIKETDTRTQSEGEEAQERITTYTNNEKGLAISGTVTGSDGTSNMEYTYDDQDRPIKQVSVPVDDPENTTTYEYFYDEQGKQVKNTMSGKDQSSAFEYTYDSEGNMASIKQTFVYDGHESVYESLCFGNSWIAIKETYNDIIYTGEIEYDDKGYPARLVKNGDDGSSIEETYEFDENGNMIRHTIVSVDGVDNYRDQEGTVYEYEYALYTPPVVQ